MNKRRAKSITRLLSLPRLWGRMGALFFAFVACAMLMFSSLVPGSFSGMRSGFSDIAAPMMYALSKPVREAAAFARDVSGIAALQADNQRLQAENTKLREWYQAALNLQAENKSLKDLLNVKLDPEYDFITARVLMDPGHAFVKSLLVSAGTDERLQKNQAVLSGDGLIGRVMEIGRNTSRVLLVTDINSRVPVLIEGSSQHAVMAGNNDALPSLLHLPPETHVEENARVVTSGFGGVFPKGIPVGRVVYDEAGKPAVKLFADFSRIVYVRVVNQRDSYYLEPVVRQP